MKKYRKFRDYFNSKKNKKWRNRIETLEDLYFDYGFSYFWGNYEYDEADDVAKPNKKRYIHDKIINAFIHTYTTNPLFKLKYTGVLNGVFYENN